MLYFCSEAALQGLGSQDKAGLLASLLGCAEFRPGRLRVSALPLLGFGSCCKFCTCPYILGTPPPSPTKRRKRSHAAPLLVLGRPCLAGLRWLTPGSSRLLLSAWPSFMNSAGELSGDEDLALQRPVYQVPRLQQDSWRREKHPHEQRFFF